MLLILSSISSNASGGKSRRFSKRLSSIKTSFKSDLTETVKSNFKTTEFVFIQKYTHTNQKVIFLGHLSSHYCIVHILLCLFGQL